MKDTSHVLTNQTTSWTLLVDKKCHYKILKAKRALKIPRELKVRLGQGNNSTHLVT
mgnify:CR=1 FL=1